MTEKPIEQFKTRKGDTYRVNVSKEVASDGTLSLQVEDPDNSGTRLVITSIKITTRGPVTIRTPRRFDVTTGTSVSIENKNIGSTDSSVANAYQDSTYSNEDSVQIEYLGSGAGANLFGGGLTLMLLERSSRAVAYS